MRRPWTGVGTALVTPFTAAGALDEAAIRSLARRQIDEGVHFLVPCGTTGESPTLTRDEHVRVVELVVEVAKGKVPVLAGAGGYNTREVIELAHDVEAVGAQGLLSVTPYYNKPSQDGLIRHYEAIASSTTLPIVLYNVPGRTGVSLDPRTVRRLASVPNIVAIKEACGNMTQIGQLCAMVPDDFIVLSGDDPMTLPMMAVGALGVISVSSNLVPGPVVKMVEAAERGDYPAARAIHNRLLAPTLALFVESNPIPIKAAMAMAGLMNESYRLPLVSPSAATREKLGEALHQLDVAPARQTT